MGRECRGLAAAAVAAAHRSRSFLSQSTLLLAAWSWLAMLRSTASGMSGRRG